MKKKIRDLAKPKFSKRTRKDLLETLRSEVSEWCVIEYDFDEAVRKLLGDRGPHKRHNEDWFAPCLDDCPACQYDIAADELDESSELPDFFLRFLIQQLELAWREERDALRAKAARAAAKKAGSK